jgi:DNA-directed RNA polymerase subunit beta
MVVRIDQSSKIPATSFLRAMSEEYGTTEQIIRLFHSTKKVSASKLDASMWSVETIADPKSGEVIVAAGTQIGDRLQHIRRSKIKDVEIIQNLSDMLIINTLAEDDCPNHEKALLKIYSRLRPGNPPQIDKATTFFAEKFYDSNRYRLGKVGRFRLNRKFKQSVPEGEMTLRPEDFLNSMKYIFGLRNNQGEVDDIDHLGN